MYNTKNLILLSISCILAALITLTLNQIADLSGLPAYLLSAFLTGMILLFAQNSKAINEIGDSSIKTVHNTASEDNRETGVVKWFDSNKGYGFITRSMGEDIFVHFRSIKGNGYRSLYEGQSVDFLVTEGDKGPQAEDIHVIK